MKIKTGDMVAVISGGDKGKNGKVLTVDHDKGMLVVEGVNFTFRHIKPSQKNPCLLYTSPSPRDQRGSRMPSSA